MSVEISVIIPAYNSGKYISKCLDSIFSQSFTAYEVIVINDGSTDNTLKVLEQYSEKIVLINQKNSGVSSARNAGLAKATGNFIAFIDSDDVWHRDKLLFQYNLMNSNDDLLACCTGIILEPFEKDIVWPESDECNDVKFLDFEEVFIYPYLGTSSFMVRSDILFSIGGFDTTLRTAEDIDLYLKIANIGMIGHLSLPLVHKAKVENSLGSLLSSYEDNLFVINRFVESFRPSMKDSELYRVAKKKILIDWATDLSWHGKTIDTIYKCIDYLSYTRSVNKVLLLLKLVVASLFRSKVKN